MELSLKGRKALVCGSTQGIGKAIAFELALLGADCILLARNEDKLRTVLADLPRSADQEHTYHVADFADNAEVRMVAQTLAAQHSVHILVNNTGGPRPGPIVDATADEFLAAYRQHVINNQAMVQAILPGMKKQGYGRIINIISTSVKTPIDNLGVSNTTRAAVAAWAKTMSNELGKFGITVNNILPGYTDTERLRSLIATNARGQGMAENELEEKMKAGIPARRFGTAAEVAAVAAFLATPAAAYVNGVSIAVDGGKTDTLS